ncbi:QXW lectin repeat family protein [Trichomonas vaginalis G3]|uniref:QXW lectin repeat family protein n=1 Tax=Trichomonas vaginalis (strain ATCC PRA-98 / G3) TaxID=412133 RepID=A2F3X2_TRIV3|nr:Ricin B-like lectins family [Trichomonas vaginalis G3]EAY00388.1 QXW lectin repeat family protein [Trichomonas vaginalis G3]KAI5528357.1 Ricin B-like lectins family [Trichomonas vaginalis G3]|eukprot:XP_001313317.1 QXW lectin repeat family protein [Trichomonas vaginalis G3]
MDCYISLASAKVDKMHALMINPETKTLQVVQYYNDPNFKFIITNNLIIHKKSGKVLDALGGATEGAQVGLWEINGCANQEWFLNEDKTIRSQNGLCMSLEKKSDYNNQNIILAKYSQNTPQWRIVSCESSD